MAELLLFAIPQHAKCNGELPLTLLRLLSLPIQILTFAPREMRWRAKETCSSPIVES